MMILDPNYHSLHALKLLEASETISPPFRPPINIVCTVCQGRRGPFVFKTVLVKSLNLVKFGGRGRYEEVVLHYCVIISIRIILLGYSTRYLFLDSE